MQNIVLYALPVLIWGSTWFVIKLQLGIVDPLLSISYRFLIGSIAIGLYAYAVKRLQNTRFTPRQHMFIALQGFLLFFLNYWIFYIATKSLTSGLVAVCFSTITIMNIFNQWVFFGLPVKKQVIIGSLMGLAGITMVFWHEIRDFNFHSAAFHNIGLCLIATYVASLGNIVSLRNSRDNMPILKTNFYGMAWGGAFSFGFALFYGTPLLFDLSFTYVWSLLYLAIFGSAVAFIAYLTLIARIGADRAAYTAVLFPIVALTISTFYEHYVWRPEAIAGLALVIAGNILALMKKRILS